MHQIAYVSHSPFIFDTESLNRILIKARANNDRLGLSGLLLYHDGNFLQVIEGDRTTVHDCFARISKDPRHCGIIKLLDEPIECRTFEGWSMAFKSYDDLSHPQQVGFENVIAFVTTAAGNEMSNSQSIIRSYLRMFGMLEDSPAMVA